jgi:anti-sigma B factor antagonist
VETDMGLNPARISMAVEPPRAVVRIVGRAAVERARDFDGAIRALVGQGVREVYLNLAECPLLDSTFSGTVALLAEEQKAAGPLVRFTLVAAKSRIVDGLANLEVLPLLKVAEAGVETAVSAAEVEVPMAQTSRLEAGEFCLRAHRALMALSAENRARFKELESMLAAEVGEGPKR